MNNQNDTAKLVVAIPDREKVMNSLVTGKTSVENFPWFWKMIC